MQDEIALFIDFENIRYSLLNVQRREPDPQELIAIARRFGTVMVARAYADWTRQPEFFKGSLTAAMIDRVDCPAKVRERVRQTQPYYQQQGGYERQQWRESSEAREYPYEGAEEGEDELEDADELAGEREEGEDVVAHEEDTVEAYASEAEDAGDEGVETNGERRQEQYAYSGQPYYNAGNGGVQQTSTIITQSTVDLNMLMDIIETVFDRPNINTFVLMTGDRDFTRICARLKLRLNKRVIVCGVPGTVSRDLISAAEQFIPLSYGAIAPASGQYSGQQQAPMGPYTPGQGGYHRPYTPSSAAPYRGGAAYGTTFAPVEPDEPGFIQFLDYIDRHWSWRTIGGVANFIGDPYNPKNRFRGRLTRDTARELLITCIEQGILEDEPDNMGNHNLRLNREHPKVAAVLADLSMQQ
jgi:uncharacterized LabA/DUF88 family protein